jgi:hypothetical protein
MPYTKTQLNSKKIASVRGIALQKIVLHKGKTKAQLINASLNAQKSAPQKIAGRYAYKKVGARYIIAIYKVESKKTTVTLITKTELNQFEKRAKGGRQMHKMSSVIFKKVPFANLSLKA